MSDSLTRMTDYKEKYEELLQSNLKLMEEVDLLRSIASGRQ
ncbi:MAG: hypothetical protein H6Q23_386 [Bacteroidetes bacterium]|nr:hypothetical protein [Bacteroidota bacterium]